jgi:hypothetical protein
VQDNTDTKEIQTYVQTLNGIQNHDLIVGAMNILGKVKVKVTLVQALRFCIGRMAHRGE